MSDAPGSSSTTPPTTPPPPQEFPKFPEKSRFALASLVFGSLGFCVLPFLGSVAAIYCGLMAHAAIRRSRGELEGTAVANWGICLGLGGLLFMLVLYWGLFVPAFTLLDEFDKVDGVVAEFREAYNRDDAPSIHARLTAQGREKLPPEELQARLRDYRSRFGPTIDAFSRNTWDLVFKKASPPPEPRVIRVPYDLSGPQGKFRAYFYCRRLEDRWLLENFEFERAKPP